MSALTKFYTHPAKTNEDVTTYEHGSHVYEVTKWLCHRLELPFTADIALSALFHDVGKLEMTPAEVEQRNQWLHTGEDAVGWLNRVREDDRINRLLELLEEDEAVDGDVNNSDWERVEDFVRKHHRGDPSFATWQSAYVVMAADALATVLETGRTGTVSTLLESSADEIRGFTLAVLSNVRDLVARRHGSDDSWEEILSSEIHRLSLPGSRTGDVLAATAVFHSMKGQALPGNRVIYQDNATLVIDGSTEEIRDWLQEEGVWSEFHMGTVAIETYGDQYIRSILGEPGDRFVPIARSETDDGYAPSTASQLNPGNVEPILSDELADGLAAKWLHHTEYEPSFRGIGIEVTEWESAIRERGWEAIEELYEATIDAVEAHASDHDNEARYPPSLDDVPGRTDDNEWAEKNYDVSKWKPSNEVFEETFEAYPCLKYFSNYWHTVVAAPTLYEYLEQAKTDESYNISVGSVAELDNRPLSESQSGGEPCAACFERPATMDGKALIAPEPKTPSRTRAETKSVLQQDPQVNLCAWCFFVGVITLPLKTQIEKGTARTHAIDMVSLVTPLPQKRMRRLLDAIHGTIESANEDTDSDDRENDQEGLIAWTEEMTDHERFRVPILDFADTLQEFDSPPEGFVLPSFNALETVVAIKQSFVDLTADVDESYQAYPTAKFVHHLLREPFTPISVAYGDPLTDRQAGSLSTARKRASSVGGNDTIGRSLLGSNPEASLDRAHPNGLEVTPAVRASLADLGMASETFQPSISFLGEFLSLGELWAMSCAYKLVNEYGWYTQQGNRKHRWELLRMFVDHPKQIANSLLRHVRRHHDDDSYSPRLANKNQIVEILLMTEQASTHLDPEKRLIENLGTWMAWFILDTNLVERRRSMYEPDGDYEPITNEVVDPLRRASILGDFRKWATSIIRLSRREHDEAREQGYSTLLNTDDVQRLMAFTEAAKAVCRERGLREETVLSEIEEMDMALYFSVTSGVADENELEAFYGALLDEAGVELGEVEPPATNDLESTE